MRVEGECKCVSKRASEYVAMAMAMACNRQDKRGYLVGKDSQMELDDKKSITATREKQKRRESAVLVSSDYQVTGKQEELAHALARNGCTIPIINHARRPPQTTSPVAYTLPHIVHTT